MKNKIFMVVTGSVFIVAMTIGSCWATLIGSHSRTLLNMGTTSFSFEPFYSLYNVPDAPDPSAVFPFGVIDLSGTGGPPVLIYNADPATTDFSTVVTYLTNGSDNELGETTIDSLGGMSNGFSESSVLTGTGFTNPDFQGSIIAAMTLTIDSLTVENFTYHVDYYDNIPNPTPTPEPATILLFGTGLASLAGYRRKRKR